MTLNLTQRLDRLAVRTSELTYWRIRAASPVAGWTVDGQEISQGAAWPKGSAVKTFRAEGRVPDDWPVDDTFLQLDLGGESLLWINYDGSSEAFGLDPYHQEFPLRRQTFSVAAESVARFPFGEPNRSPVLECSRMVWIDRPVDELVLLLTQVAEAAKELKDHEVAPHLIAAAEHALAGLDWPSATDNYVARTASSPQQQKIWQLPVYDSAPHGINESHRQSVIDAYNELRERLRSLKKIYPSQGKILLTGHAHIDLAWLWPYAETRRKTRRTFHSALSLMDGESDFRFNQSTAHYYAQLEEDDPALLEAIKSRVEQGSWETIGGLWIEPDTNMPTGESLARHVLYGQRYFERVFGRRHDVCWLPDCFGFSPALPQLLRQGGISSFFTIKVNWNEANAFPHDLFWWEGLDGSQVLAHTFNNPVRGYNGDASPKAILSTWRNFRGKTQHDTSLLAVGYGDGGGGVTPEMIARERQLRDFPVLPEARWGRIDDFFSHAHRAAEKAKLPVWSGEIYLELHRGTLTSQSNVKRLNRRAERALIAAETVTSLAWMLGGQPPSSLEADWRILLKNQFHDILPGSSIAEVYQDAGRELNGVVRNCMEHQSRALGDIADLLPRGDIASALVVANPSLHARPLQVRLDDGTRIESGEILPAMSVSVVDLEAVAPSSGLSASDRQLENDYLIARISSDGTIQSLIHKATGREALDGPGNRLWAFPVDKPRNWDAWDIEEDYAQRGECLSVPESIALVENTPDRAAIEIRYRFRDSSIIQRYVLTPVSRRLDIETEIDWHDRRVLLRSVSAIRVRSRTASFECAYGVIERPTHSNTSWDAAMFEAVAHRFVDISEPGFGVALLNDAKYGHSARGNTLGISLLRSPIYPDPLADEGRQTFTYALMPHADSWHEGGVREEAENLNQPLPAIRTSGLATGRTRPVTIKGMPVGLSALKIAENEEGVILRIYEPAGRRGEVEIEIAPDWKVSESVNVLEETLPASSRLAPFEVKTWRLTKIPEDSIQ